MDAPNISERVLQFLSERINTVPQLEALLLLWREPDKKWSAEEIAARVYVSHEMGQSILRALSMRQLAVGDGESLFSYSAAWDGSGTLMAEVERAYRRHLVRITTFIHSGASSSVRDFARAFDFRRDQ